MPSRVQHVVNSQCAGLSPKLFFTPLCDRVGRASSATRADRIAVETLMARALRYVFVGQLSTQVTDTLQGGGLLTCYACLLGGVGCL
jgi:hypothetical protein